MSIFLFRVGSNCLEDEQGNCMSLKEIVEIFEWWLKKEVDLEAGQVCRIVLENWIETEDEQLDSMA